MSVGCASHCQDGESKELQGQVSRKNSAECCFPFSSALMLLIPCTFSPPQVLRTFLHLQLHSVDNPVAAKGKRVGQSKKERKKDKEVKLTNKRRRVSIWSLIIYLHCRIVSRGFPPEWSQFCSRSGTIRLMPYFPFSHVLRVKPLCGINN